MLVASELEKSLKLQFKWHKARVSCFVKMLIALFAVKTVNLREMATAFQSQAYIDSRHKRLKRFFSTFSIDFSLIAKWIFALFFDQDKPIYLTIDRTNWCLGKQKINVFVLAIAYEGIAIPIIWKCLPKKGTSNFQEQRALLNRYVKAFGQKNIAGLLADREFANGK